MPSRTRIDSATARLLARSSGSQNLLLPALLRAVAVLELCYVVELPLDRTDRLEIALADGKVVQIRWQVLHRLHIGRRISGETGECDLLFRIERRVHELLGQLDRGARAAGDDR